MFLRGAIRPATRGRRKAIFAATSVAILSIPLVVWAFTPPPSGETGLALTGSTCGTGSCHSHGSTVTSGTVTAAFGSTTYTPNGAAIPITVTLGTGGNFTFEMSAVSGSGTTETQAGSFNPGTGLQVVMGTGAADAGVQYIEDTSKSSTYSFTWTPPATNVGTVTFNLAGSTGTSNIFANTFTLAAASGGGGGTPTISATPAGPLTFSATAGGTNPVAQSVSLAASDGSAQMFTAAAAVTTPAGGTWLSVAPASGSTNTTPSTQAISVALGSLGAGSYSGTVTFTPATSTISPVSVTVNLTVSAAGGGGAETYSLTVVDRLSGGADYLLLYGSGDATPTGGGGFARFRSGTRSSGGTRTTVVSHGTWTATSVTSNTSGCLVLKVLLSTGLTGTLTISDRSSSSSASLVTTGTGGATWNPAGVGSASLGTPGTGCSTTGGGGTPPPDE